MPSEEPLASWRKALTSIYFHGRRERIEKLSATLSRRMMSLEKAIDVLEGAKGKEGLHALRLALGDLIRTRASRGDPRLDRHIRRLSTTLRSLQSKAKAHDEAFTGIFGRAHESPRRPEDAYREAMEHMHRMHHEHNGSKEIVFPLARHESHWGREPPFRPDDDEASETPETGLAKPRHSPRRRPRPRGKS